MMQPNDLTELELMKRHTTDGDRRDLLDYRELAEDDIEEDDIEGYPRPATTVIR